LTALNDMTNEKSGRRPSPFGLTADIVTVHGFRVMRFRVEDKENRKIISAAFLAFLLLKWLVGRFTFR
jgi:hypothetical protein